MKILAKIASLRVGMVSYLNTIPFIYGLDNSAMSSMFDLRLGNPNKCFQMFRKNEVDISLIPVGSLTEIDRCSLIMPHCIGADGPVGSVFLLSDVEIENIETVFYDLHSLTSNKLVEILFSSYWKRTPVFRYPELYPPQLKENEAIVAIGDKSFKMKQKFKYVYDLAEQWKMHTGKAFVFAVWVTRQNLHPSILQGFNEALDYGVNNIPESIVNAKPEILSIDETYKYLKNKIVFRINDSLKDGMSLFLDIIHPDWKNSVNIIY